MANNDGAKVRLTRTIREQTEAKMRFVLFIFLTYPYFRLLLGKLKLKISLILRSRNVGANVKMGKGKLFPCQHSLNSPQNIEPVIDYANSQNAFELFLMYAKQ